jgi:hypothetical protein
MPFGQEPVLFRKVILIRRVSLQRSLIAKAIPNPVRFSLRFLVGALRLGPRVSPRQAGGPFPTPDRRARDASDGEAVGRRP